MRCGPRSRLILPLVMAGHSRPKDGVASARLWPGHPSKRERSLEEDGLPGQARQWRVL